MFQPPASLRRRIAPTEIDPVYGPAVARRGARSDGALYGRHRGARGLVHNGATTWRRMRRCCWTAANAMASRAVSPLTVKKFTEPADPPISRFCAGWAGTWIRRFRATGANYFRSVRSDIRVSPAHRCGSIRLTNSFVILLTNVVHPDGRKSLSSLRSTSGDDCGGRRSGWQCRRRFR